MTLSEIATVSGKGGLFKVLAPTKSGVILESMDEAKTKLVATTNHKLSLLNEISIYTTTKEGTVPLAEVLRKINKEYGNDTGVDANSDSSELKSFLKSIQPDFDENRVYTSDIKKLVKWYEILLKHAPEVINEEEKAEEKVAAGEPEGKSEIKDISEDAIQGEEKEKKEKTTKASKG
jgi:Fe2+ transport system protein B